MVRELEARRNIEADYMKRLAEPKMIAGEYIEPVTPEMIAAEKRKILKRRLSLDYTDPSLPPKSPDGILSKLTDDQIERLLQSSNPQYLDGLLNKLSPFLAAVVRQKMGKFYLQNMVTNREYDQNDRNVNLLCVILQQVNVERLIKIDQEFVAGNIGLDSTGKFLNFYEKQRKGTNDKTLVGRIPLDSGEYHAHGGEAPMGAFFTDYILYGRLLAGRKDLTGLIRMLQSIPLRIGN